MTAHPTTDPRRHFGNTTVVRVVADSGVLDPDALRAALLDVLTHCPHEDLARPSVLAAVGAERAERDNDPDDPCSAGDSNLTRLADLTSQTGQVANAMVTCASDRSGHVYDALTCLVAIALAWLDELADRVEAAQSDNEPPF
jgi:hypothetical protein